MLRQTCIKGVVGKREGLFCNETCRELMEGYRAMGMNLPSEIVGIPARRVSVEESSFYTKLCAACGEDLRDAWVVG